MALKVGTLLPSLGGATRWFNGEVDAEALQGHPVLLHFWAVSCPACLHNMSSLHRWKADYELQGLRIVAVHLPRLAIDRDREKVQRALAEHGISWPCAVDEEGTLGERFDTGTIWPYYFLFDAEGRMRSRAAGGVGLRLLENALLRIMSQNEAVPS